MIGAIIGDIVGSRYERRNHKSKDFEMFDNNCSPTDDSIMSLAIAKAILDCDGDYSTLSEKAIIYMREFGRKYKNAGYAGRFREWIFSKNPEPYGSYGNGSAMRVGPCGFIAESIEEAKKLSESVTKVTHNHPEGLKGAEAVAVAIYLARSGKSKDEIKEYISKNYYDVNFTIEELRPKYSFDVSCQGSVPVAFAAFFESNDFEDAIRTAISVGGDSDTIACMAGVLAEAYYGVPERLIDEAIKYLDITEIEVLYNFEKKYISNATNSVGEVFGSVFSVIDKKDLKIRQSTSDGTKNSGQGDVLSFDEDDIEIVDEYMDDIELFFKSMPDVAKPLLNESKKLKDKIEKELYKTPAFIEVIKSCVPNKVFQAVLTDEQTKKLADGSLKLMTKKDGSLLATLVDPKTKKTVSQITLKDVDLNPELSKSIVSYSTQMQMAQIAEQIEKVQISIGEVKQGLEDDRLAIGLSCQQRLLQASKIQNNNLKMMALLQIIADSENSRNQLMKSQEANVSFIMNQPRNLIEKLIKNASDDEIEKRFNDIREGLNVINMVSLVEALAYHQMDEDEAAKKSLEYYAEFIKNNYIDKEGVVERLDSMDPSPENYWTKSIPKIEKYIMALPIMNNGYITKEENDYA